MAPAYEPTPRSKVRRKPLRAAYDEAAVHGILDSGVLCHVGYVIDGQPFVTPTTYWREGRKLYWHGSAASRMIKAQTAGLPVCVTVSFLDGLKLAKTGIVHSMQYRSVMAFGRARRVEELETLRAAMNAFIDRLYPGRAAILRPMTDNELKQIGLVEMTIEEAVAKQSAEGVTTIAGDEAWAPWSGVIPVATVLGHPMADPPQGYGPDKTLDLYAPGARLDAVLAAAAAP